MVARRPIRHFSSVKLLLTFVTALVTLYVQFLCSDWSKCDVFNCLFPLDVQNEIQLLSGVFCYSWLVCLLGFCLRNTSLVKVRNPILDGIILLIISNISCNFNRFADCFQSFSEQRFPEYYSKCRALNHFKIKNKDNKFFIMLERNCVNVHSNTLYS